MSRHIVEIMTTTGKPVVVTCGWDRPLQGFFMSVKSLASVDEESPILFDCLELEEANPRSFDEFREVLISLHIEIPAIVFEELDFDRDHDVGNKIVRHDIRDGVHIPWLYLSS